MGGGTTVEHKKPMDTLVNNILKGTANDYGRLSRDRIVPSSVLRNIVLRDPDYQKAQGKPREYIQK